MLFFVAVSFNVTPSVPATPSNVRLTFPRLSVLRSLVLSYGFVILPLTVRVSCFFVKVILSVEAN